MKFYVKLNGVSKTLYSIKELRKEVESYRKELKSISLILDGMIDGEKYYRKFSLLSTCYLIMTGIIPAQNLIEGNFKDE